MKFRHSVYWVLILALAFLAAACGTRYLGLTDDGPVVHEKDSWEWLDKDKPQDQQGMLLEVTDFNWRYVPHTGHIEVQGHVINKTGKLVQSVRILVQAYDQFDKALGTGETFIMPTILGANKKGSFRFFLNKGEWVTAIQLKYRFSSRIE